MSAEHAVEMYKDKPLRAKLNYNVIILMCILSANIVALCTFSSYCQLSTDQQLQNDDPVKSEVPEVFSTSQLMRHMNHSRRDMHNVLNELMRMRDEMTSLREKSELLAARVAELTGEFSETDRVNERVKEALDEMASQDLENPWMQWARGKINQELQAFTDIRKLPLGWNPALQSDSFVSSVGHACTLHQRDLDQYMSYKVGEDCPDDETLAQRLLLAGCEPLPRRRCFAQKPWNFTEPVPFPESLWTLPEDNNILWTAYPCKSFQCLNERSKHKVFADCLDCFNLEGREKHRWVDNPGSLDFAIADVLKLKPKGTIKIGLDMGGGTASFAARMREHNVTIVTSTLNLAGPFNNFIAHRGLVPLFLTISQRLPFFDNSLDIVHSMHVLSNWIPTESLEFLLFDIDRVLRPGGLFWLDHFFCVESQLEIYVPMIERFGYVKHRWMIGQKLDRGAQLKERYISALLEKPYGIKQRMVG